MMKVVQCWDDGVNNDVRLTELFRKYGAKATFNLNPGLMDQGSKPSWIAPGEKGWSFHGFRCGKIARKDIAEVYDGFQLASHCWRHENAGMVPDSEWIQSALQARRFLEDLVQRECRGFAWPCGRWTHETVRLLRENGFAYGRTTENVEDVCSCREPMTLASNCHYQAGDFWERYERAKQNGCKVFYFWGHSYEMFEYEPLWQQLEDKIRFITEDPETEWADVIDIVPLLGEKEEKGE